MDHIPTLFATFRHVIGAAAAERGKVERNLNSEKSTTLYVRLADGTRAKVTIDHLKTELGRPVAGGGL